MPEAEAKRNEKHQQQFDEARTRQVQMQEETNDGDHNGDRSQQERSAKIPQVWKGTRSRQRMSQDNPKALSQLILRNLYCKQLPEKLFEENILMIRVLDTSFGYKFRCEQSQAGRAKRRRIRPPGEGVRHLDASCID